MMQSPFVVAIVLVLLLTSGLAVAAVWIGGGRAAVVAQRRVLLALFAGLFVVAFAVGLAAEVDARLTGLVVGVVSVVVALWLARGQAGFPRVLAAAAAIGILASMAFFLTGR